MNLNMFFRILDQRSDAFLDGSFSDRRTLGGASNRGEGEGVNPPDTPVQN